MTRTRTLPTDLTDADVRDLLQGQGGKKKPSKYRNEKTEIDGERFDSRGEAAWFMGLQARVRAGEVRNLRRQVKYALEANGVQVASYVADAVYEEKQGGKWVEVVADFKGMARLPIFNLKARLFAANYGMPITCVDAKGRETQVPKPKAPPTPRTVKKERK